MTPQDNEILELDSFLKDQGIVHFSGKEVLTLRRFNIVACCPDPAIWSNILPALKLAEVLRSELGPLSIGNGYRPKILNKKVGGARNSQHIYFRALDIDLPRRRMSIKRQTLLYRLAAELYLDNGDDLKMGLGIYRPHRGTRIHIDCGWKKRAWGGPKGSWWSRNQWVTDLLNENR